MPTPVVPYNPGLDGKFLVGYQGWFAAKGDGDPFTSANDSWIHWSNWLKGSPNASNVTVDMWPDTSEYSRLYPTAFTRQDGSPAALFSSYDASTVQTHFRWMREYGIDGAVLQRFTINQPDPATMAFTAQVALNVRAAAEANGRVFCILIDVAGTAPKTVVNDVINEWNIDVNALHLTDSPNYLRDHGKPVVYLAEFGNVSRPAPTLAEAKQIVAYFKNAGVTVVGMTPFGWRTLEGDAVPDAGWLDVYHSYDVIVPWTVGSVSTLPQVDAYAQTRMTADIADAAAHGQRYMPVVFPGFSRSNLCAIINDPAKCPEGVSFNSIPRQGGTFWWEQAVQYKRAGATMMYGAMFDEVDEGTAIFKLAPTQALTPAQAPFVTLDADGYGLPSDWYLQLARETAALLHGARAPASDFPLALPGHVAAPSNANAQMLYSRGSLNLRENHFIERAGFVLYMQEDGNLVLKDPTGAQLWASGTSGLCLTGGTPQACLVTYQFDGNLVVYNLVTGAGKALGGIGSSALIFNRESANPLLFE